jgi:hypothetical protein
MKEITLNSGNTIQITLAPFKEAKALFQAVQREMSGANLDADLARQSFLAFQCSEKVEQALEPCMRRVLYNGLKIDDDTFEPEKAREDYLEIRTYVIQENIVPFSKSLCA